MGKTLLAVLGALLALVVAYFLIWPVPIDPRPWTPPPDPGYTGPFAVNERLQGLQALPLGAHHGPEDIALDAAGRIYAATHDGTIVRLSADGSQPEDWFDTAGRPLGLDFDADGNLIVADAYRGLLRITPGKEIRLLADTAGGVPIRFADDVDVAPDGKIYFSDASTKFGARAMGGTYEASLVELMEHGLHGRLLVHDPATGATDVLLRGLCFANGVAVSPDGGFVLVSETGNYRVLRHWLRGPRQGQTEPLIEALPGFPDNVSAGLQGRFWVALVSPRNPLVDRMADKPFVRKLIQRLPDRLRPAAVHYGHVFAVDRSGRVLCDLQDPQGAYPMNTSVTETAEHLYIGSLIAPTVGRLGKDQAGL